jgi:hypothetical protein
MDGTSKLEFADVPESRDDGPTTHVDLVGRAIADRGCRQPFNAHCSTVLK